MKPIYLVLLAVNILILGIDLIIGNNLPEVVMLVTLFYVMISTPIYLYLQLKNIKNLNKK